MTGAATETHTYDGDGVRVKAVVNGVTSIYVGAYYEVTGGVVKKYYYAGSVRVAERNGGTLYFLLTDHLGSTATTTDASGNRVTELRYYPYGDSARYNPGGQITTYRFTGQRWDSGTGLYFYGARWYDPLIGRFIQADTVVPQPGNPQSLNRYAYVGNNPLKFVDPTGMYEENEIEQYLRNKYPDTWESYLRAWRADKVFWAMLRAAQDKDVLWAPSTGMSAGIFGAAAGSFTFSGQHDLYEYQGYGPYALESAPGQFREGFGATATRITHPIDLNAAGAVAAWEQPLYDYSGKDGPVPTSYWRVTQYTHQRTTVALLEGSGLGWLIGSGAKLAAKGVEKWFGVVICPACFTAITVVSAAGFANNAYQKHYALTTDYINRQTYIGAPYTGPVYKPDVPNRFRR